MYRNKYHVTPNSTCRFGALIIGLGLLTVSPLAAQPTKIGIVGWTLEQAEAGRATLGPFNENSYPVPGVSDDVGERFRRAASLFTHARTFPTISVMTYDYVTRCGLTGDISVGSSSQPLRWVRYPQSSKVVAIPGIARDSLQSMRRFALNEQPVNAPECAAEVSQRYGEDPSAVRGAKKLAEHSLTLLSGAQIGSKEAPVTTGAFTRTVQGRIAAMAYLDGSELVGAYNVDERTIVILGKSGGQTRFASQYRNLPDGRWRFEGASALGVGLAKYLENAR